MQHTPLSDKDKEDTDFENFAPKFKASAGKPIRKLR